MKIWEFKIDALFLSVLIGFIFIIIALSWYRVDSRKSYRIQKRIPEELLTQFIKSVGKVGLLMLGILFIGVPVTALIIKSGTELQNGMQFFNGFSAVVFGLAIAAAGAWVSIKLAHVATEIASNHFYSEESSKRYNEAKQSAELVHKLDFSLTNLLINAVDFADRVINYGITNNQENQKQQEQQLKENLKSFALLALNYSKLYQQALQTPLLLEAIHSEFILSNKIQSGVKASSTSGTKSKKNDKKIFFSKIYDFLEGQEVNSNEFDVFSWLETNDKPEDVNSEENKSYSTFLNQHFSDLAKCFKELALDYKGENTCGKDRIFEYLKFFAEKIHRNAVSLNFSIDSNLIIPISDLADVISGIRAKAYEQYEKTHNDVPSTSLQRREVDIITAFYILDYFFTHGSRNDGIPIDNNLYIPAVKDKKNVESSRKIDSSDEGVINIDAAEVSDKGEFLTIKPSSNDEDVESNIQFSQPGEPDSSGNKPFEKITEKSKKNSDQNSLETSKNSHNKKLQNDLKHKSDLVDVSALHFASANYVIPRMPRELLSVKFCKNDEASNAERRFEAIKQLYAGENGIHILKTGRAAGQHSNDKDLQAIELQLYVFRTLSTSVEVGNAIIGPFVRVGNNGLKLRGSEFCGIGEKIQLAPFKFKEF